MVNLHPEVFTQNPLKTNTGGGGKIHFCLKMTKKGVMSMSKRAQMVLPLANICRLGSLDHV